jgi:hypothetical protein
MRCIVGDHENHPYAAMEYIDAIADVSVRGVHRGRSRGFHGGRSIEHPYDAMEYIAAPLRMRVLATEL